MKKSRSRAHISRSAIQRLYIEMRHLVDRGRYKPIGRSGEAMIKALHALNPEIYGTINDPDKVELDGLLYVFQRLPQGIEQCRYVKLISREGFEASSYEAIVPSKRRRNCYRIDDEQMYIEMTRGRSDVYDVLTHLTFFYNEAEKIGKNGLDSRSQVNIAWKGVKRIVEEKAYEDEDFNKDLGLTYLSTLLGRTFRYTSAVYQKFLNAEKVSNLFSLVYHMGRLSLDEKISKNDRQISFSSSLVEKLGQHIYGEAWAMEIKKFVFKQGWMDRSVHIISSNLHSVMNTLYASSALAADHPNASLEELAQLLSQADQEALRQKVKTYALAHGMHEIKDHSGTNISVQIFDCAQLDTEILAKRYSHIDIHDNFKNSLILVMDYAFGEQAYETMDELLKPYTIENQLVGLDVESINIMGKAGILEGDKGDIMIATAHVMEGFGDNYPFTNELSKSHFEGCGLQVYEGNMITVMGTSLQNKDILKYFLKSSWQAIGLEMEGGHYQKAIQANSRVRKSISPNVKLRYAYYASDNPLKTGSTLASGSLGLDGVKPTYLITQEIVKGILTSPPIAE